MNEWCVDRTGCKYNQFWVKKDKPKKKGSLEKNPDKWVGKRKFGTHNKSIK